jgi:hypothetical protein
MYFTETKIDFSTYQVIAVFDEVKGNGGWSIDITGITEWQDKMLISVTNLKKGDLTSVITQPFQIVKIPVAEKEIEFEFEFDLTRKVDENPHISLADTQWNLEGISNVKTGELRVLKSHNETDCENCYTLRFETDTTGFGRSCVNALSFNINGYKNRTNRIDYIGVMTYVYEIGGDCGLFIEALPLIDDCFFNDNRLIFAYTQANIRYHLIYKKL